MLNPAAVVGRPAIQSARGALRRATTGSLVRRLAFWVGQDVDVAEYVRSCQTCQRTKAKHSGPRGLIHPVTPCRCRRGAAG